MRNCGILLLTALALAGAAPLPPMLPGDADERVPFVAQPGPGENRTQEYPLWSTPVDAGGKIGADDLGITHILYTFFDPITGDARLAYANNRFETRGSSGSGYSEPFFLSSSFGGFDIAVHPDGTAHVVWAQVVPGPLGGPVSLSIIRRTRQADGLWQGPVPLFTGSAVDDGAGNSAYDVYFDPVIGVDGAGTIHVACRREVTVSNSGPPPSAARSMTLLLDGATIASSAGFDASLAGPFRLKLSPTGTVHLSYQSSSPAGTVARLYANGAISDPTSGASQDFVFGIAPSGAVHVAYISTADFAVRYGLLGGPVEIPTNSSGSLPSGSLQDLLVDSREQPILLAGPTFASKVRKTDGTRVWGFGLNLALGGGVIDSTDTVHGGLSRSQTPNLAAQDPFTMFGAGPASSVNVANGNLFAALPLFASRGAGLSAAVTLYHNSLESLSFTTGLHWSHTYDITLNYATQPITPKIRVAELRLGDGRRVPLTSDNHFYSFADPNAVATHPDFDFMADLLIDGDGLDRHIVRTKSGTRYIFHPGGKLNRIADSNSNTLACTYDTDGRLSAVTDTMSRTTTFAYNAQGLLETVTDPAGRTYRLEYSGTRLIRVRLDPSGLNLAWEFDYHAANNPSLAARRGLVSRIRTPRGTAGGYGTSYSYYPDSRLKSVVDPADLMVRDDAMIDASESLVTDATRLFTYEDPAAPPTPAARTLVQDRRGNTTRVEYDHTHNLATRIVDPAGLAIVRTFGETYRTITSLVDRRGFTTTYAYDNTPAFYPAKVRTITRPGTPAVTYAYSSDGSPTFDDGLNRVTAVTDARGNTTSHAYDTAGNLLATTHPPTALVTNAVQTAVDRFTYGTLGRVATAIDAEGGVTTYRYDDAVTGLVTEILQDGQPPGSGERFTYDRLGNTLTRTAPPNNAAGGTSTFILDSLYRVIRQRDPLGNETLTTYDENSNVVSVLDAKGRLSTSVYDRRDLLKSTTTPAGTTSAQYDREGAVRRSVDGNGSASLTRYDTLGRVSETRRPSASTLGLATAASTAMTYTYDPNGNVATQTAVPGRVTTFTYDERNNPATVTHPIPAIVDEMFYDANDNPLVSQRLEAGVFRGGTFTVYDERNRVKKTIQTDARFVPPGGSLSGPITAYLYDRNSNRIQVWNPNGSPTAGIANSSASVYDRRQRLIRTVDGTGTITSELDYHEDGSRRTVKTQDPSGSGALITTLSLAYTVRGELLSETDALGKTTSFTYDATGRLSTRTDPLGHLTRFDYDSSDRLSTETRCDGEINILTGYGYDANSNRTTITVFNPATQANNAVYRHHYTQANQLERIENPSGRSESWTYNAFGELETHTDANGKVQTNSYDSLGRLRFEFHGAPYNVTIERQYDGAGNLTFISDGTTAIDDGFDPLNRRLSSSWTVNGSFFKALGWGYDDAGNRTQMTDPEGALHAYGYDADNRPSTLSRAGVLFATLGYDLGGRRKSVALKNGARTEYGFNNRDETTRVRTAASSGQVLASYAYEYNDRGERTVLSREHLGERVDFAYDCAARLMGEVSSGNGGNFVCRNFFETTPGGNESADSNVAGATPRASTIALAIPPRALSWTYDNAGNRTAQTVGTLSTAYQYDADNRLVREIVGAAVTDYAYDANGNQISRVRGGVTESFAYDYANRLVGYTSSAGSAFSYGYAPTGERLRKTNLTTLVTEWFMYDGADVVTDYTQSGSDPLALQTSYVQSLSIDSKIARISASGEEHFYVPDALGSVTHLLDSNAAIVNSEVTDAWGNVVASSNAVPERYGFSHRERDPETALMHFRARSYDPRTGRFLQTEPMRRYRAQKHYTYADDNPVQNVDPTGLWAIIRKGGDYAVAYGQKVLGDTLTTLAQEVHLDEAEAKKWLRIYGRVQIRDAAIPIETLNDSKNHRPITEAELKEVGKDDLVAYVVPNVMLNVDTIGGASGFYFPGILAADVLRHFGPYAASTTGGFEDRARVNIVRVQTDQKAPQVKRAIQNYAQDGKLWGFSINGHGGPGIIFEESFSGKTLKESVGYRLALVKLYACGTKDADWLRAVSQYGKAYGYSKEYCPGAIWGPRMQEIQEGDIGGR